MLVKTFGSALNGIDAITVTIEVNIDRGVQFFLVGLPDSAVKESQQRIESALSNNGLKYPKRKITINMAPADIRKEGSSYDLPLAIAILAASEQMSADLLDRYITRFRPSAAAFFRTASRRASSASVKNSSELMRSASAILLHRISPCL